MPPPSWFCGYDGFGQRVRKTVNGTTTRYLLHEGQVALELSAAGAVLAEYTYYPGTDRPHGMKRGGVQYFYVQDAQGNVSGLLNASGAVVETYTYTPHGVLVGGGGSGVVNPHRFKGREWDAESGLYYMRARYYDAALGRFLSEDPIGLPGGLNLYLFVEGDPVNYADPSGLEPECIGGWALVPVAEGSPFDVPVWRCPGGFRHDPVVITPRARGSFFFMSSNPRGTHGFSGGDARDVFTLLGSGTDAMTTGITLVPSLAAQEGLSALKFAGLAALATRRSLAQLVRSTWPAARRAYWKASGPNGVAPTRWVEVRFNRTGQTRWIQETKELHHKKALWLGGGHDFANLREAWPSRHAMVDPFRFTGYVVLQVLKVP